MREAAAAGAAAPAAGLALQARRAPPPRLRCARIAVDRGAAILRRQRRAHLLGFAAVGVSEGARHDAHPAAPRIVSAGFQLLHQLRQGGNGVAQQGSSCPGCATASYR